MSNISNGLGSLGKEYLKGGVKYDLFTDGGCFPNPGPGGWACIVKEACSGKLWKRAWGREESTTNNRMELTAVIKGINCTPYKSQIELYTDSTYIVNGITTWRFGWKRKNWKNVINGDLWKQLDDLLDIRDLHPNWVRGHDGHPENEECDKMCLEAYRCP